MVLLQAFYSQVSSPLMRRIAIQFPEDSVADVTQDRFEMYFSGSELVVAGRVLPSESNTLTGFTTAAAVSGAHAYSILLLYFSPTCGFIETDRPAGLTTTLQKVKL